MGNHESNEEKAIITQDKHLAFVYSKSEKIATAIYLVTNLLSDKEPMKWSLRHHSISLLGEILPLESSGVSRERYNRVLSSISSLETLLSITHSSDLVSDMNSRLLKREISGLRGVLDENRDLYLSSDFFSVPISPRSLEGEEGNVGGAKNAAELSPHSSVDKNKPLAHKNRKGTETQMSVRKNDVLKFLRKKGVVSIKEIAGVIKGCSEKTINRDLHALLDAGLVKREGTRRWTKYRLP